LKDELTFLKAEDIADTPLFALQAPWHLDVAELFVLPTSQGW
jgi:NADP-dependent 3-hydroxy acid dehydrogenase YdfG